MKLSEGHGIISNTDTANLISTCRLDVGRWPVKVFSKKELFRAVCKKRMQNATRHRPLSFEITVNPAFLVPARILRWELEHEN